MNQCQLRAPQSQGSRSTSTIARSNSSRPKCRFALASCSGSGSSFSERSHPTNQNILHMQDGERIQLLRTPHSYAYYMALSEQWSVSIFGHDPHVCPQILSGWLIVACWRFNIHYSLVIDMCVAAIYDDEFNLLDERQMESDYGKPLKPELHRDDYPKTPSGILCTNPLFQIF